ncbi:hypothetical protein B4133_1289 [Bacillus altitudinis]|nr:hypothetical protein B4133_1289 [Bacillus altitudinis]
MRRVAKRFIEYVLNIRRDLQKVSNGFLEDSIKQTEMGLLFCCVMKELLV